MDVTVILKGPSQPVCIAAVCSCYYPGDLISFTVQMARFVRISRRGYVLPVIFRLPSKRKLPGRLTWHLDLNEIGAYKTTEPLDCQIANGRNYKCRAPRSQKAKRMDA